LPKKRDSLKKHKSARRLRKGSDCRKSLKGKKMPSFEKDRPELRHSKNNLRRRKSNRVSMLKKISQKKKRKLKTHLSLSLYQKLRLFRYQKILINKYWRLLNRPYHRNRDRLSKLRTIQKIRKNRKLKVKKKSRQSEKNCVKN